ncbi:MAG: restriction endonuclease subunit S, partial [Thermodesulfobacteriota bacterium]
SKKYFRPIPTLVPSEKVLAAFSDLVKPMHKQTVNNVRESATFATIRDTLLPKLISGEIRVKDVEKFVEATV